MPLINRVAQLLKADVNAVLDRIEEPEQLLRQAIRDMQEELAGQERQQAGVAQEAEQFEKRRAELEHKIVELDGELDLCFEKQKHDLARSLVRRKLEAQRLAKRLQARGSASEDALQALTATIAERRTELESLRQKAAIFAAPEGGQPKDEAAYFAGELTITDDELDVALLREQEKRAAS